MLYNYNDGKGVMVPLKKAELLVCRLSSNIRKFVNQIISGSH